jgi:hypothetical protein
MSGSVEIVGFGQFGSPRAQTAFADVRQLAAIAFVAAADLC